ncbi:cupin domain-containing protein [Thauera humireducens]|uniref:cupin domain-containing protein n=1 Tax=Thauera humireducens TaxID=1134435 RepID=UPI00311FC084
MNLPTLETLLGGLSAREFLAEYWQKKPLLIRQAVPGFTGVLSKDELFDLACDPDVESRYIRLPADGLEGDWTLEHGPQSRGRLRGKKQPWTVLVQGLNLWVPDGDRLLHRFDFIPQARLDDLMVSYAVDGGGVGPHFDNYDVFLLQGMGKRRWQISDQADRSLIEGAPLRILKNFQPAEDWVLEPGDMLYLPPHWAHNGVAIGECTTYSIGFARPPPRRSAPSSSSGCRKGSVSKGCMPTPILHCSKTRPRSAAEWSTRSSACSPVSAGAARTSRHSSAPISRNRSRTSSSIPLKSRSAASASTRPCAPAASPRPAQPAAVLRCRLPPQRGALEIDAALRDALATLAHRRALPADAFADAPDGLTALLYDWYENGFGAPAAA